MQNRNIAPAALILAAVALVGCSPTAEPEAAATPSQTAPAATAPGPTKPAVTPEPDPCPFPRPFITLVQDGKHMGTGYNPDGGRITGLLKNEPVDLGPSTYAEGTANFNDAGEIVSYTVAPGDVYEMIYKRFCFTNFSSVLTYNNGFEPMRSRNSFSNIHPGDVLILRPDPTVEWLP